MPTYLTTAASVAIAEPCDCPRTRDCSHDWPILVHVVKVEGCVWEQGEGQELGIRLDDVWGLPEHTGFDELDPRALEACHLALKDEWQRREDARDLAEEKAERLKKEAKRIAEKLSRGFGWDASAPAAERLGALASAVEDAMQDLERLTKEAA